MAIDIKPGDEVITTPFTWVSTAEVIALLGAKPVFVDIELETGNIDHTKIEAAITKKTKAIIPVSLYGQTSDMDFISDLANKYSITVIEDGAQSFGAEYKGRKSCNLSEIGCTSFFPSKPLGCYGDGGAIFTNDAEIAKACSEIRVHGQESKHNYTRIGVGGRMDTIQCAVVLEKLKVFSDELKKRNEIADTYNKSFEEIDSIKPLKIKEDRTCVWAQYTLIVEDRDSFIKIMKNSNIPVAIHYPNVLYESIAYKSFKPKEKLVNVEYLSEHVISIPMSPYLDIDDQHKVIEAINLAI